MHQGPNQNDEDKKNRRLRGQAEESCTGYVYENTPNHSQHDAVSTAGKLRYRRAIVLDRIPRQPDKQGIASGAKRAAHVRESPERPTVDHE